MKLLDGGIFREKLVKGVCVGGKCMAICCAHACAARVLSRTVVEILGW